jgi:hypothetical protein
MLFPKISAESVLQVNDKTRIGATRSYVTKDEVALTVVEIEPEAAAGFISVFNTSNKNWFLDYEYATDGAKVVTLRVDNGSGPVTSSFTINVLTEVADNLFSTDDDLKSIKTDILKWLPDGKSSFKYVHRKAQNKIVDIFDAKGIIDSDGNKLTKAAFVDVSEAKEASILLTLHYIFDDFSNSVDDIEAQIARDYLSQFEGVFQRPWRLDLDGNNVIDLGEGVRPFETVKLFRKR